MGILKRCPSCRTLCDAEKRPICFACGGDLTKSAPAPAAAPAEPEVFRTARQDRSVASVFFILFALLGGVGVLYGMVLPGIPYELKFGVGAVLVGALLLGVWSETTGHSGRPLRILTKGLALFGMIIATVICGIVGLLILLFAACSLRLIR